MEKKKNKLFINGVDAYLENIDYKASGKEYIQAKISQKLALIECNEELVTIRMTRSIQSEDEFKLVVSCIGKFHLEKKSLKNFKNLEDMRQYASERMGYLVDKIQMGAVLTQIIANITGTFGRTPTILPPIINENTIK